MTYVSNPFPCFVIKAQHGQGLFPLRCFFAGTDDTIVADDAASETMSWKHLQQLLSLGTHGTTSHWQIWQDYLPRLDTVGAYRHFRGSASGLAGRMLFGMLKHPYQPQYMHKYNQICSSHYLQRRNLPETADMPRYMLPHAHLGTCTHGSIERNDL